MPSFFGRKDDKKSEKAQEFETKETRTMHLRTDGLKGRKAQILDEDNSTVLYDIDIRFRRPNLTFRSPARNNETVGTIKFSPMTRAIEADTEHGTIHVKSKNWKCCDLPYTSPAFGGRTLTWQRRTPWVVLDHYLIDENGLPIARFRPKCSFKNVCAIDFVDRDLPQDAIDEIIMTGLAVLKNTEYYACSAASAAASSSVAAAS
ncbi:uncharacterized protein A1O9_02387 [Exophiala aquamarina CBS 119918]|uniref:Tubby C-terminal domain-containing protein n=1 Tax=Exophiala aquamarina CBS 119918 TaxID=1182545 RepID=A0A072PYZ2_9EURO|nr:uncharacterized protein A1O9_02387 [Exophiala aquamarina CBS 119918]KEF60825.1 hypothetical protein A1O9_02387 [Exophiala aquamarina CBS 119918]